MVILSDIKQTLGENTEKLETKISPYYTNLEPWQRGLILIALSLFLLFSIYYLTKPEKKTKLDTKKEKEIEEKILRQMAFFKRLRE